MLAAVTSDRELSWSDPQNKEVVRSAAGRRENWVIKASSSSRTKEEISLLTKG